MLGGCSLVTPTSLAPAAARGTHPLLQRRVPFTEVQLPLCIGLVPAGSSFVINPSLRSNQRTLGIVEDAKASTS